MWATDVVNDEPGLLPGEVEVELEGHRQGDVVDATNLFFLKKMFIYFMCQIDVFLLRRPKCPR